jgi:hypothetical protein
MDLCDEVHALDLSIYVQAGIIVNYDSLVDLRMLRLIQSAPLTLDQTRAIQRSLDLQQIAMYVLRIILKCLVMLQL